MSTEDRVGRITDLLSEAAELHHAVYRISDGDDPDWASWYADWLLDLSELPEILGGKPVRSELIYELVRLGKEYEKLKPPGRWQDHYARALAERFSSSRRTPSG